MILYINKPFRDPGRTALKSRQHSCEVNSYILSGLQKLISSLFVIIIFLIVKRP